jgi:hypothetical protein
MQFQPITKILEWKNISFRLQELVQISYATHPLLSFALFLLFISTMVYIFKRSKNQHFHKIALYCIFVIFFTSAYLLTTCYAAALVRYYLMGFVLLLIILGIAQNEGMRYRYWWLPIISVLVFASIFINLESLKTKRRVNDLMKVAEYIQNEGYSIVEASFWNSGVLKIYTNGYINSKNYHGSLIPYMILTDRTLYKEDLSTPTILLTTDNEEKNFNERAKTILAKGEKLTKIGQYNLYKYSEGQLILPEFPTKSRESREFSFKRWNWLNNANFDYDANALATKPTGGEFYGPYLPVRKGSYKFTLEYEVISSNADIAGEFVVSRDHGRKVLSSTPILSSENHLTVTVHFKRDFNFVQTVGRARGAMIKFKRITITKE